ncbi:MAG: hypothetical protein PF513_01335 [Tenericutes bacterium]|nr:hypothetical protein [Mycoplasmatota bacterium]
MKIGLVDTAIIAVIVITVVTCGAGSIAGLQGKGLRGMIDMKFYEKLYLPFLIIVIALISLNLIIENYDNALLCIIPLVLTLYSYFRKKIEVENIGLLILAILLIIFNSSANMQQQFTNKLTHDLHIYISYIWLLLFSYKLRFVYNKVILYSSYFVFVIILALVVFVTYRNTGIYTIEIMLFVLVFLMKDIHSEVKMDISLKKKISQEKSKNVRRVFLLLLVIFMLIVFGILLWCDNLLMITLYITIIYFTFEVFRLMILNKTIV